MEYCELEKREVIKSNYLIESSYRLTAMEQKIIYYGSTMLDKIMINNDLTISEVQNLIESAKFSLIYINTCDFAKTFGIKTGNIYELLEDASKRLYDRDIIYVDKEGVTHKRWVITCRYEQENARIALQFHQDLIPDLLIFKDNYTILKLNTTSNIKSGYTYRLYELLKQYVNFGIRIFEIKDFRFKLNIKDDEYKLYSNLKQSVINPAIKNINKTTDLEVSFIELKEKRKITKIKFFIKLKENFVLYKDKQQISFLETENSEGSENEASTIIDQLQSLLNYDITAGQAQKILDIACYAIKKFNLKISVMDYISEKKIVIDEYGKKNKIDSYIGILIKALSGNWSQIVKNKENLSTFNNFKQRDYDFDDLKKKLLGWDNIDKT